MTRRHRFKQTDALADRLHASARDVRADWRPRRLHCMSSQSVDTTQLFCRDASMSRHWLSMGTACAELTCRQYLSSSTTSPLNPSTERVTVISVHP